MVAKAFDPLVEHLQFTQEGQLLQLHIGHQSMRLRQLEQTDEQGAINRNLIGLPHGQPISVFNPCAMTMEVSRL